MFLPDRHLAEVPQDKITKYLLATDHPEGGDKAVFFINGGFSPARPEELSAALLKHAHEHMVTNARTSLFGTTYAVDGPMATPSGITMLIRSVWVVEPTLPKPRFVTAYPLRRISG